MPILLNYKHVNSIERRSPTVSAKAEEISPHAIQKHHTPAFNTVHIIAAIIGIAGAIGAAVTIFILCKRRRSKTQAQNTRKGSKDEHTSNDDDALVSQTNSAHSRSNSQTNHDRFDQFANDFDGNNGNSDRTPEDTSPTMQQYQLQLKLLQQQHQERRNYQQEQQQTQRPPTQLLSANLLSPPPPPYYP